MLVVQIQFYKQTVGRSIVIQQNNKKKSRALEPCFLELNQKEISQYGKPDVCNNSNKYPDIIFSVIFIFILIVSVKQVRRK